MDGARRLEADEAARLAALQRYEILDTEPEEEFEEIVSLIKSIFSIPFAAINLIDHDRQWAKAAAGMCRSGVNCDRADAFCDHTIRGTAPLIVEDARQDPRFKDNHFVVGPAGLRSYLGVPLRTPEGYNIGALCVFGDEPRSFTAADVEVLINFSKVVMSQFELRLTARVDGLTGVLTRTAFLTRMERLVAENRPDPASLVLIDLDHFKSINDDFGHPVGDIVLNRVASEMSRLARKSDWVGRVGGEEFAILLNGAELQDARVFSERLRTAIAQLKISEIGGRTLTVSIGIAERRKGEARQAWYERADRLLYVAKDSGRDRAVHGELVGE